MLWLSKKNREGGKRARDTQRAKVESANKSKKTAQKWSCKYCGGSEHHKIKECPAYDQTCRRARKETILPQSVHRVNVKSQSMLCMKKTTARSFSVDSQDESCSVL